MTSKSSFSNAGLLREGARRSLWMIVLAGVGFFLSLVLPVLMMIQRGLVRMQEWNPQSGWTREQLWAAVVREVRGAFENGNYAVKAVFVVLAVSAGIALFSYLHARQKVDFYHSLPISRSRLFWTNFAIGPLCTVPVYFIMLGVTLACVYAMGFGEAVVWKTLAAAVVCHMVMYFTLYALAVLAAVLCGNTIISLLLYVCLTVSPAMLPGLYDSLCSKFYQTYCGLSMVEGLLNTFQYSPLIEYFGLNLFTTDRLVNAPVLVPAAIRLLAVYLVVGLLAAALGWYLFRIRKSERAGTAIAFEPFKLPLKVYLCVVMGVAFGLLFNVIAGGFWFWIGLLIGAVLTHWVAEIIYSFDFRAMLRHPIQLAAIAAAVFALMLGMNFDVTGFDRWMPAENRIEAVGVMNNGVLADSVGLTSPENMQAVRRLAELGIEMTGIEAKYQRWGETEEDQAAFVAQYGEWDTVAPLEVGYRLTGGRIVGRRYFLYQTEEVRGLLRQVFGSEEYKRIKWPLFAYRETLERGNAAPVVGVYTNTDTQRVALVDGREQVMRIVETLCEESLARTEENAAPLLRLELQYVIEGDLPYGSNRLDTWVQGNAYVTAEDTRTLALIRELAGVAPQALRADMLESIRINYQDAWQKDGGVVSVTDRADMEALLQDALSYEPMELWLDEWGSETGVGIAVWPEAIIGVWPNGDECMLVYPTGKYPEAVIEKYRPAEPDTDEDTSWMSAEEMAERAAVGYVG